MELWIRSQYKMNLVKINQVSINYQDNKQIIANYVPELYENSSCYYELLGTYSTKERALEVLDEIENLLIQKYLIRIIGNTQKIADFLNTGNEYIKAEGNGYIKNINNTVVYEMPEK